MSRSETAPPAMSHHVGKWLKTSSPTSPCRFNCVTSETHRHGNSADSDFPMPYIDFDHISLLRQQAGSGVPNFLFPFGGRVSSMDCDCPRLVHSISAVGHTEDHSERSLPVSCRHGGKHLESTIAVRRTARMRRKTTCHTPRAAPKASSSSLEAPCSK